MIRENEEKNEVAVPDTNYSSSEQQMKPVYSAKISVTVTTLLVT
jgi:hypothetical protein